MATTLKEIKKFLEDSGLHFNAFDEDDVITIGFSCDPEETTFRDRDGDPCLQILLRLVESGEFLVVVAPFCWNLQNCPNRQAVCEALAIISGRFKMIRWDFDPSDGEVRPNIELALEDASLTAKQLQRAIAGILQVVRQYDRVITRVMETGEISFHDVERHRHQDVDAADSGPPTPAGDIARLLDLADQAGGLDAIERLLGGGDPPPVQT
jgi:hypothetical protein